MKVFHAKWNYFKNRPIGRYFCAGFLTKIALLAFGFQVVYISLPYGNKKL